MMNVLDEIASVYNVSVSERIWYAVKIVKKTGPTHLGCSGRDSSNRDGNRPFSPSEGQIDRSS